MRIITAIIFVLVSYSASAQMLATQPQLDPGGLGSYAELYRKLPGIKWVNNPVIAAGATYTNICPSGWVIDPNDPTQFFLYVGEFLGNTRVGSRISVYTGNRFLPYGLTYNSVVLTGTAATFDADGVSFGSVVQVGDTLFMYYSGKAVTTGVESIGVATSLDGLTWTKRGQALAPLGTNADRNLTDPGVYYESGTWYMFVTRKEGTTGNNALPTGGIISATSTNGKTFTRTGTVVVALGTAGATADPDSKYIEGGQIFKLGSDYCFLYTATGTSDVWNLCLATSTVITNAFTKAAINPVFQHSNSSDDSQSVAVPLLVNPFGHKWVMYYQGSAQTQPASDWDLFAATFQTDQPYPPAGFLANKNNWSGAINTFDISGLSPVIAGLRTLRGLTNAGTVSVTHATDVTPGGSSYYEATIRCNVGTGNFRGGFYVMEGANIITGVYFNAGNLSYLKNTGWTTLQGYSANTNYTIKIALPNLTQHTISVNGTPVVSNQTNFTAIVTKANIIKLEKDQASNTSIVYFDSITCTDGTNTFTEGFEEN